ncbi:unnamed protein product [Ostreobium quekettii]|uniref:Uncharacterized protein n=1 Tax=Ostreobium quekettii TaxID=121088 RepID=A0A8S1IM71_9CHLO|nr:unnamed protein product [Ostreobium quekettii]CAD7698995.1 unnamed protein product [Ostreobium quekettii]|eukprot:evm.model.scf_180.9 EVM.evm.TU.scf_180.9   scf_180:99317-102771(+)
MSAQLVNGLWGRPTVGSACQRGGQAQGRFVGNDTASKAAMKSRTCLVEVIPAESEPTEVTFKKFSSAVRRTGMYFEVRRRQRFECKQDRIKRKRKEKPLKKRIKYIPTFAKASGNLGSSVPPFADLFDNPEDDIFAEAPRFGSRNGKGRQQRNDRRQYQPPADSSQEDPDQGLEKAQLAGVTESEGSE